MFYSFLKRRSLPSASLSRNPLADIWRAIRQRDAAFFASGEKIDLILASQRYVLQVQYYPPTGWFRSE